MIPYDALPKELIGRYAVKDVMLTLQIVKSLQPYVEHKQQEEALTLENKLIFPFFEMERQGFLIDQEKLSENKQNLKAHILQERKKLKAIAGEDLKVGQHKRIKTIMQEKFGLTLASTGGEELKKVAKKLDTTSDVYKLMKYAIKNITSFSSLPLQAVTIIGTVLLVGSLLLGIQTIIHLIIGNLSLKYMMKLKIALSILLTINRSTKWTVRARKPKP